MRLLFIKRTYWKDINGHFEAGQDAYFLPTNKVKKLVKDKKAIKIPNDMNLTRTNREFLVIQNTKEQTAESGD